MIIGMEQFGNTSSASIPLTLTTRLQDRLAADRCRLIMIGFGVGFSWAAASVHLGPMTVPELVIYREEAETGERRR
jgi:3-oxoacyl-[acyl-carrier-protein] synthase-3